MNRLAHENHGRSGAKARKILFACGPEFLRTPNRTNPFFDPIISVCEKAGFDWKVLFVTRDARSGYPSERVGSFALLNALGIWFWRLVRLFRPRADPHDVYRLYGRLARPFLSRLLEADLVVTIAGYLHDEYDGMFPEGRIVDVQHGVIYSTHSGYFLPDSSLAPVYRRRPRCEFWVYGKGYAASFYANAANERWLGAFGSSGCRVRVLGDVMRTVRQNDAPPAGASAVRDIIAFSAQLTHDDGPETLDRMVAGMVGFFENMHARYGSGCRYILKHHPRFGCVCDVSRLTALPYLEVSEEPWSAIAPRILLHATFSSTVAFDVASVGAPTFFLPSPDPALKDARAISAYRDCPFLGLSADEIVARAKSAPDETARTVRAWFETFYAPFDEANCRRLLETGPSQADAGQNERRR